MPPVLPAACAPLPQSRALMRCVCARPSNHQMGSKSKAKSNAATRQTDVCSTARGQIRVRLDTSNLSWCLQLQSSLDLSLAQHSALSMRPNVSNSCDVACFELKTKLPSQSQSSHRSEWSRPTYIANQPAPRRITRSARHRTTTNKSILAVSRSTKLDEP